MVTDERQDFDCFVATVDTAKEMRELVVIEQMLAAFAPVDAAGEVVQACSPGSEPGDWLQHLWDLVAIESIGFGFSAHCRRFRTL
mgnify:CR=1 FL=1